MGIRANSRLTAGILCLLALAAAPASASDKLVPSPVQQRERSTEPAYRVQAGLDGEVFPVFANYASLQRPDRRKSGVVTVTIANHTAATLKNHITVELPGWSDKEIQTAEVAAGASRQLQFAPSFLPRFYANRQITAASALVTVADAAGRPVHTSTVQVRLRSAEDMYWGPRFRYAPFIAGWITPHDERVEKILARAKEQLPGRRLPGYEPWKSVEQQEAATGRQARAIYNALKESGVSYVKSSHTLGANTNVSQRVRMPGVSVKQKSANCIDGVVLFAALFENLGMEPMVALIPGHAYVGVRLGRNSSKFLFIDTALVGRASFEQAVASAEKGLDKRNPAEVIKVYISAAREAGIFPMPQGE